MGKAEWKRAKESLYACWSQITSSFPTTVQHNIVQLIIPLSRVDAKFIKVLGDMIGVHLDQGVEV